jgi:hypothetical protein
LRQWRKFGLRELRHWRIRADVQIVRTSRYLKDMKRLGASASDMARLETEIAANPQAGDVIPGLSGLRKIRFALGGKGKRGGGRAIYFLMVSDDLAVLVFAYSKSVQEDLTPEQRKAALALIKEMNDG